MDNWIMTVAKEVLGESKGKRHYDKETWWWSVEFQEVVREKRRYKFLKGTRNMENYDIHKAKKEVKKVLSDAKFKAYDYLYNKLGTREGYF